MTSSERLINSQNNETLLSSVLYLTDRMRDGNNDNREIGKQLDMICVILRNRCSVDDALCRIFDELLDSVSDVYYIAK